MTTRVPAVKDALNTAPRTAGVDPSLATSAASASAPRSHTEHTSAATEAYRDIEGSGGTSGSKFNEEWDTTGRSKHSRGVSTSSADHMILSSRTGQGSRLASGTMRDHDSGVSPTMAHGTRDSRGSSHTYNQEQLSSPFHCPIPTDTNPSEILAGRFEEYRQILKDLISYFKETGNHYETRAKAHQRLQQAATSFNMPKEFLESSGLADGLGVLQNHNHLSANEAEKSKAIEEDVVAALTSLRSELSSKIKEIRGLTSDFKTNMDHEMDGTKKAVRSLTDALNQNASESESSATGKSDPYLLRHAADRQVEKQLKEENYLQQAHSNLEASGRELESIVVYEIQKSFNAIAGMLKRESTLSYNTSEDLRSGIINMPRDAEWNHWVESGQDMFLTQTPKRTAQQIMYPGMDHPSCRMIRSGPLERKGKYLKSFAAGWYVLSPTHLHEFKSAESQTPVMSLYLPDQTLGSHSSSGGSNNKFILKGRQTGTLHRGHTWIFRAENYQDMMGWYNEIKALLEPSAVTGGVALGGSALGSDSQGATKGEHKRTTSSGYRSSSSDNGVLNEDDEVPWAGVGAAGVAAGQHAGRPVQGGRFSSATGKPIDDPSITREPHESMATRQATGAPTPATTSAMGASVPVAAASTAAYPTQKSQQPATHVPQNQPVASASTTTSQYQAQPYPKQYHTQPYQKQYQPFNPNLGSHPAPTDSSSGANWIPAAVAGGAAGAAGAAGGAYAMHKRSDDKNHPAGAEEPITTSTGYSAVPSQDQFGTSNQYPTSSQQPYSSGSQNLSPEQQQSLASRGFNVGAVAAPTSASNTASETAFDKSQAYENQYQPPQYSSQNQTASQLPPTSQQRDFENGGTEYPQQATLGAAALPVVKNKNISRPQSSWSTEEIRSSTPADITAPAATKSSGYDAERYSPQGGYSATEDVSQKQDMGKVGTALAATGLAGAGTAAALSSNDKQSRDTKYDPSKHDRQTGVNESETWNPLNLGRQIESQNQSSLNRGVTGAATTSDPFSKNTTRDATSSTADWPHTYPSDVEKRQIDPDTHRYPGSYPDEETVKDSSSRSDVRDATMGAAGVTGTAAAATGLAPKHQTHKDQELGRSQYGQTVPQGSERLDKHDLDHHGTASTRDTMAPPASASAPSRTEAAVISPNEYRAHESVNKPRDNDSSSGSTGIIGAVMGAVGLGGAAAAMTGNKNRDMENQPINDEDYSNSANKPGVSSVEESASRPDISRAALGSSGALPREQFKSDNSNKSRTGAHSDDLPKDASTSHAGDSDNVGSSSMKPGGATTMPALAGSGVTPAEVGRPNLDTSGGKQLDVNPNEPHVLGSTDRPKAWSMVGAAEEELRELGQLPSDHTMESGPTPAPTNSRDRRGSMSLKPTPRTNENLHYQVTSVPGQLIPTPETHRRRLSQVSNPDPSFRRGSLGALDQTKTHSSAAGQQDVMHATSNEATQPGNSQGMLGGIGATVAGAATTAAAAVGLTKHDSTSLNNEHDSSIVDDKHTVSPQTVRDSSLMDSGAYGSKSVPRDTSRYTSTDPYANQHGIPDTSRDTTQSQGSGGVLGGIGATVAGAAAAAATAVGLTKSDSSSPSTSERGSHGTNALGTSGTNTVPKNTTTSDFSTQPTSSLAPSSNLREPSSRDALPIVGGSSMGPMTSRPEPVRDYSSSSISSSDYDSDNEAIGGVSTKKTATNTSGGRLQDTADPETSLGSNVGDMLAGAAVGSGVGAGASKLSRREKKQMKQKQKKEEMRDAKNSLSATDDATGQIPVTSATTGSSIPATTTSPISASRNVAGMGPTPTTNIPTTGYSKHSDTDAGPYFVTQSTPSHLDDKSMATQKDSLYNTSRSVKEDYWNEPSTSRGHDAAFTPDIPATSLPSESHHRDTPGISRIPEAYNEDESSRTEAGSRMGLGATVAAALGAGAAAIGLTSSHDESKVAKDKENEGYSSSISSSSDYEGTKSNNDHWAPASAYKNSVTSAGVASASGRNAPSTSASKAAKTTYPVDDNNTRLGHEKHTHPVEKHTHPVATATGVGAGAAATAAAAAMAAPGHHDDEHSGAYHMGSSSLKHATEPALRTNQQRETPLTADTTYRMTGGAVPTESERYDVPAGVTSKHVNPEHTHGHTPVTPAATTTRRYSGYHMKSNELDHPQDDIKSPTTSSSRGFGTKTGTAAATGAAAGAAGAAGAAAGTAAIGSHGHGKASMATGTDNSGLSEEWSGPWNRETEASHHPMTLKEELQEAVHEKESRGYGQARNTTGADANPTNPAMTGRGPTFFASETTDSTAATVGSNSSHSTPTGSRFTTAALGTGAAAGAATGASLNASTSGPTATTGVRSASIPTVTGPGVISSEDKYGQGYSTMAGTRDTSQGETLGSSGMTSTQDYGVSKVTPGAAPSAPGPSQATGAAMASSSSSTGSPTNVAPSTVNRASSNSPSKDKDLATRIKEGSSRLFSRNKSKKVKTGSGSTGGAAVPGSYPTE